VEYCLCIIQRDMKELRPGVVGGPLREQEGGSCQEFLKPHTPR
jgi:hypothetical protein